MKKYILKFFNCVFTMKGSYNQLSVDYYLLIELYYWVNNIIKKRYNVCWTPISGIFQILGQYLGHNLLAYLVLLKKIDRFLITEVNWSTDVLVHYHTRLFSLCVNLLLSRRRSRSIGPKNYQNSQVIRTDLFYHL